MIEWIVYVEFAEKEGYSNRRSFSNTMLVVHADNHDEVEKIMDAWLDENEYICSKMRIRRHEFIECINLQ